MRGGVAKQCASAANGDVRHPAGVTRNIPGGGLVARFMSNDKMTLPKTTEAVTIYATSWCPYCQSLIGGLKKRGVPFEAWDVEKHADLAKWVESVNGGNRVVPTVLYSDGTHATNPAAAEVEIKHAELTAK